MAKMNWKTLGILATIAGGVLTIASGMIDDKKRSEEIREEVRNEIARQNEEESE